MDRAPRTTESLPPPPLFGVLGDDPIGRNGIVSLVDVFDDFVLPPEDVPLLDHDSLVQSSNIRGRQMDEDSGSEDDESEGVKTKKRRSNRHMTEEQKVERRYVFP